MNDFERMRDERIAASMKRHKHILDQLATNDAPTGPPAELIIIDDPPPKPHKLLVGADWLTDWQRRELGTVLTRRRNAELHARMGELQWHGLGEHWRYPQAPLIDPSKWRVEEESTVKQWSKKFVDRARLKRDGVTYFLTDSHYAGQSGKFVWVELDQGVDQRPAGRLVRGTISFLRFCDALRGVGE